MKIKRFNESSVYIGDMNYYPISKKNILDESDFKRIHESGRKVYYLNKDADFVECVNSTSLKRVRDNHNSCNYLLFVDEETINNESLKGLAKSTKEMEDLYKEEINNRYKLLVGAVDKVQKGE